MTVRQDAFNSPLETGLRALSLLVAAYPGVYDLSRMVTFDHLVVHTGDIGGPDSLHAAVPMRTAELLVRRDLVERGLFLMVSKGLAERRVTAKGIVYVAGDFAETFISSLASEYVSELRGRASWIVDQFGALSDSEIRSFVNEHFDHWIEQFQAPQQNVVIEQ